MSEEGLDPVEVGRRLRIARETAGMTQAYAATSIDVARTTLVAMEKGQRAARTAELLPLAKLYETSVNALLRLRVGVRRPRASISETARVSRKKHQTEAARLLEALVQAEVELENLLGVTRPRNDLQLNDRSCRATCGLRPKMTRPNSATSSGLGLAPVHGVTSLLEFDLGIRVYVRRLDARVSGLFAYDEQVGACMLLNANHPRERRAQSAAHELGHFVSSRQAPEVLYRDSQENSREERYANAFARAFLTPARTVMQRFRDVTQGASHLTRRHVILLAHAFGVSREAMVRRLEELGLTKSGELGLV